MRVAAMVKKTQLPNRLALEDEYAEALWQYLEQPDEVQLGRAYELGRRALQGGTSLVEIAAAHHQALSGVLRRPGKKKSDEELLRAGAEFLAETVSVYEMAHRGFQDGIKALRQLNETLEEEIKRIAYAVHDEAGQLLVAVHLALEDVARDLPKAHKKRFARIEKLLRQVEQQLRRYSHELRPTVLDDLGWIPAIRFLAEGVSKRAKLPIEVNTTVRERLPGAVEIALYRIVQEALNNAVKHAKASRVQIQAHWEDRVLCCSVQDDGEGFEAQAVKSDHKRKGLGLVAMQERLSAIGGMLSIESAPGKGTKLLIRLPMENANAN